MNIRLPDPKGTYYESSTTYRDSYFPIEIELESGEKRIVVEPEDIPVGTTFKVLRTQLGI